MKTLDVGDVIERLEDIIEEWGPKAKGGDFFDSNDLINDARGHGYIPHEVKLVGFEPDKKLPVCLVGTLAAEVGSSTFTTWGMSLTDDAQIFLDHVVNAVDGEVAYGYGTEPDIEFPKNPTRSWRKALDAVKKAWGLA